ncbi:MAG: excinuclease ABC subunit UvrA [Spirochaetales bacterium]|jgi:excinuclease ABC subunit A|nr:excinuclease ABC subunit UvrA [Spirochaetales bacterium]
MDHIVIRGAREHNLKNIDIDLPRDSLITISGLSGSGKSSLAFDTIYAEGQRRYVESLSAYARQFLGRMNKPEIDYIEGLSPAISIEQKTTHKNPRSTVGTVTEIYDYLRLLFARVGVPHCPSCGKEIHEQSTDQILDTIMGYPKGSRLSILAPVLKGKKGEHRKVLDDGRRAGFVRVRIDGVLRMLDEDIVLDKKKKHTLEIVVDRIKLDESSRNRLAESVETALGTAEGQMIVVRGEKGAEVDEFFSQKSACPDCGISLPELQPRLFSFNNPYGACPECAGLGITLEFDEDLVIPDKSLSYNQGAVATSNPKAKWQRSWFEALSEGLSFSLDTPFDKLDSETLDLMLRGSDKEIRVSYVNSKNTGKFEYTSTIKGILNDLKRRYLETTSQGVKDWLEGFMTQRECSVCQGRRLRAESLAVTINDVDIDQTSRMSILDASSFFNDLKLSETEKTIAQQILKEITGRLKFMINVGLDYLSLERRAATLSGGEAQRIRLATQIGSSLVGVLYILDEPTIGLHQRDNQRLIETLIHLRDIGNTLIVVEHDEQTLRSSDFIVDLGPGAGIHGGTIVASGTIDEIEQNPNSLTGLYLSGRRSIEHRKERRQGLKKSIRLRGAKEHNLKNINVDFPLGCLIAITGVSGSGKSTLLNDILYPVLSNSIGRAHHPVGEHKDVNGIEEIDKVISIDQSAIGRTPRSNPATYVALFGPVRDLFTGLPESRARGYKPGRFSFNVKGGRCENCQGAGLIKIEMHFLPDVYITCDVCKGKRFNKETLDVRYKGRNIYDILEMTVEEAYEFFTKVPVLERKLGTLKAVGLDYIRLGQSALTLSGGEAQRVKLSLELSKRGTGKTFYILDEPTTGLHFEDVKKLMEVVQILVEKGNTVALIEHNLDVLKQADYIIDLGPEGGHRGGEVIVCGTPEEVAATSGSFTGQYLKTVLKG